MNSVSTHKDIDGIGRGKSIEDVDQVKTISTRNVIPFRREVAKRDINKFRKKKNA